MRVSESLVIRTTDLHTAGEPVRIIEDGYPELKGGSILEKRRDALRTMTICDVP